MGSRKTGSISAKYSGRGYEYAYRRSISKEDRSRYPTLNYLANERESIDTKFQSNLTSFSPTLATTATKSYILYSYPILRDVYFAYKFSKYAYEFSTKVQGEYERNGGDLQGAVITAAESEKGKFIEKGKEMALDYLTRHAWNKFKEENNFEPQNPVFDDLVQDALSETMQEMIS